MIDRATKYTNAQLALRDKEDNWREISRISPKAMMEVLEGPIPYQGYLRYKIKTLSLTKESQIGWVVLNWADPAKSRDLNQDDIVDMEDILGALSLIGQEVKTSVQRQYDLNEDDKINIEDAFLINTAQAVKFIPYEKHTNTSFKVLETKETGDKDKSWTIHFNKLLNPQSISNHIKIIDGKGKEIGSTITMVGDEKSVIITPMNSYTPGENYYLLVENNIEAVAGGTLKAYTLMKFMVHL